MAALINFCFISVSFAAENSLQKPEDMQLADLIRFGNSSQVSTQDIKNSDADLSGTYLSTPQRCRECHKIDRKASNLIKAVETRDNSCDWCHSDGAGSMYLVSMDNGDNGESGYGIGHSRGFSISNGKWKAPDDTYPAFTPRFWRGGMSCLDCHPAHDYPGHSFEHKEKVMPFSQTINVDFSRILKTSPGQENNARSLSRTSPGKEKESLVSRMCVDCHRGDAGLSDETNLVYSEENALQGKTGLDCYIKASTHDAQPDRCTGEVAPGQGNGKNSIPECRSCHCGSNDCNICHNLSEVTRNRVTTQTSDLKSPIGSNKGNPKNILANVECSPDCMSLGLSWPHRTLGWKMLKDELFGIDYDGREIKVGQTRRFLVDKISLKPKPAQDLDSVCLDCHNANAWNPGAKEPVMRGLP